MIKYFTYYSCGGYKDIYVGSDSDSNSASYFIPLLNVWKKSSNPKHAEKIARAESVQQVELITKNNPAGFPSECNLMFSHGGYRAIYRTLSDGKACLSIRDIPNSNKDEEGRDIPFNFLFLADGEDSIERLDGLAIAYLSKSKEINDTIANAISYDPIVNGIKFDLTELNSLVSTNCDNAGVLNHQAGTVDYLMVDSRQQSAIALKEQAINSNMVKFACDDKGAFYGHPDYKEQGILQEDEPSEQVSEETEPDKSKPVKIQDYKTELDIDEVIESRFQQVEQKMSVLAKSDDVEVVKSMIEKMTKENEAVFVSILGILNILHERTAKDVTAEDSLTISKKTFYMIAAGCLIVGFILGAIIL